MIKTVTVCGSGVLGGQIAYQCAFHGFDVRVYDISEEAIARGRVQIESLPAELQRDLGATPEQTAAGLTRLSYHTDLAQAVQGADLVIEAVPENLEIKREFYRQLAEVAAPDTIFVTNSSTLLPSDIAEATGRPDRFLALHFANRIWRNNTAEVMGSPATSPEIFGQIVEFAGQIGMVALPLYKEQPGYILNSLLVPWLNAALDLVVREVADPHTVDRTWMIATKAPLGPFATYDIVGLTTAYHINQARGKAGDPRGAAAAAYLKDRINRGLLGMGTGEGFYTYPDPAYRHPDFLTPAKADPANVDSAKADPAEATLAEGQAQD
ncbi:3-hydroxyacyl-CoA dehydrogenase [Deinococcus sp. SL84]|uniref:3-hydroxyacyl-CoA dehydrogenase n=1 Tax=Deinococcus sp. SL84 TaxID=2994663 RepID=UPI002275A11E|nr:3-hydroxyacyl-CoA dehydrogenase [Deinococcus sp. SL84]MCY1702576.1 3-hydroxyacyl-CoA dehydrogenase [Deinococcus sp. SL84]